MKNIIERVLKNGKSADSEVCFTFWNEFGVFFVASIAFIFFKE